MKKIPTVFTTLLLLVMLVASVQRLEGAALGNGIRISEVTATSAIVWTRVTRTTHSRLDGVRMEDEDEAVLVGRELADVQISIPGTAGEVRVAYWPMGRVDQKVWTKWEAVSANRDFAIQVPLVGLMPNQAYQVEAHLRAETLPGPVVGFSGKFKTAPTVAQNGWVALFDGSPAAMENFHLYNLLGEMPERWSVVGGLLTVASRKEAPDLRNKEDLVITTRGYRDYELELSWKASVGANGGIFYKVVEAAKYDKPWHTGLEYQLLDNAGHEEGLIPTHRAGDLYDMISSTEQVAREAMTWNHSRIVVKGPKIEHWLNGVKVVKADTSSAEWKALVSQSKYSELPHFAKAVPGHIILQDHGDRMWFRDILIKEL